MLQTKSVAPAGSAGERIVHDKPIALRLTQSERDEAFQLADEESRSASSFALFMYRRGVADFKAKRAALQGVQ